MTVNYRDVLASLRRAGDEWRADVTEDWLQGRTVFGGLQVALGVRAMRDALGEGAALPLRSLQATFVGPLPPSRDLRLRAETLRHGKSASQARCDLVHDGAVACTVVAVFGAPRASQIVKEIPRPVVEVDPEALQDLPWIPGITPNLVQHMQLRWARGTRPYTGHHEPRSLVFARLNDRLCGAEEALIALADCIPPPALSMLTTPAPASSLNLMVELLGDPAGLDREQWSLIDTEVRAGTDGYLSQTSTVWGPSGHAFAVSHQTVAIYG